MSGLKAGLKQDEFWLMTPAQVMDAIHADYCRMQAKHNMTIMGSWYGALFERQKRLPKLDKFLHIENRHSPERLRDKWLAIKAQFN